MSAKNEQPVERLTLSITEAAEALGVSRRTMYELLNQKSFMNITLKIGSRRLVSRELLAAWVREQAGGKEGAPSSAKAGSVEGGKQTLTGTGSTSIITENRR